MSGWEAGVVSGEGEVGWRDRLITDISLVDKRVWYGGGAALLVLGAVGIAANALDVAIAGAASAFVSVALADLGLAFVALPWLVRQGPAESSTDGPPPAAGLTGEAAEGLAADPSTAATAGATAAAISATPRPVAARRRTRPASTGLDPADEKHYRELAVVAGRGPVPPAALGALWGEQALAAEGVARLVDELVTRGLVGRDGDGALVVPDSAAAAAASSSASDRRTLVAAHGRLVDAYRTRCPGGEWWRGPDDGYFFENIAHHLAQANRATELNRLLMNYDWLRARLANGGILGLLADFAEQPEPDDVAEVGQALAVSAACLAARPDRLASHLTGRLVGSSNPGVAGLLEQMRDRAPRPWICPLPVATSTRAGTRARKPAGKRAGTTAGAMAVTVTGAAPRHDGAVRALAVTPDGKRLVTGGDDHAIRIWDLASGRLERTVVGHTDAVRAVAVTPDGRRIVSGGTYDVVRVWDFASGQFVHTLACEGGYRAVYSLAVTPDGRRAVWAGAGPAVHVWDLAHGRIERTFKGADTNVRALALTPDGKAAVSAGDSGVVSVWDMESGRLVRSLDGHAVSVLAVAVTPDGSRVVSGGHDSTVQVWDLDSGRLERTLWGHTSPVEMLAVTPDGRHIVSCGQDRKVRMWDLDGGQEIASWSPEPELGRAPDQEPAATAVCAIPADAPQIACGDSAGFVQVLRLFEA